MRVRVQTLMRSSRTVRVRVQTLMSSSSEGQSADIDEE